MKFVLENRSLLFDFQLELHRQKDYYDWLNRGKTKELQTEMIVCSEKELKTVCPDADLKEWCPVGSVEFCVRWYKDVWDKTPLPKNVPDELIPCCTRKILNMEKDEWVVRIPNEEGITMLDKFIDFPMIPGDNIFRKDTKTIKSCWNGIIEKDSFRFNDGDHRFHDHFQVSEIIPEIYSEWRCFVYDGKLIDIKNYSGDPFNIPNKEYIEELISKYKSAPVAYTLDLAQCNFGTEIIEVHDFFSCGLYGFNDPKYPIMLWRWFKEFTK